MDRNNFLGSPACLRVHCASAVQPGHQCFHERNDVRHGRACVHEVILDSNTAPLLDNVEPLHQIERVQPRVGQSCVKDDSPWGCLPTQFGERIQYDTLDIWLHAYAVRHMGMVPNSKSYFPLPRPAKNVEK